jgi:arylsulfatase A-like enzyme
MVLRQARQVPVFVPMTCLGVRARLLMLLKVATASMNSIPKEARRTREAENRLGPLDVLLLSAWCGLAAGELEVGRWVLYRAISSVNRLYLMTRQFVWLIPLVDLLCFATIGAVFAAATILWPRRAGWWGPRIICALAILSILLTVTGRIYFEAWLILALGMASCLSRCLERRPAGMRRWVTVSLPVLLVMVLVQASWNFGGERLKQWREESRPLPRPDLPNVLLIVLDTARADHLSLHGYERGTSPNLERLAKQGIRFDHARATAPWTLPSHASMFTGRWPHELNAEWMCPLGGDVLTVAEFLGSCGYATAGFVGNTACCSYDSGLDRGFTDFQDYVVNKLSAIRTVHLIDLSLKALARLGASWQMPWETRALLAYGDRKVASDINREFLDWLARRHEPRRPFFAFLNYLDSHGPYVLPAGAPYRFGSAPKSEAEFLFLVDGWLLADKLRIPEQARTLLRDSYDNCLAYLDERLGELFDELRRLRVLDQTLVIVTADHGEGLGEHELFNHGESLYRTEIHVPLLIVAPANNRLTGVVEETVSLRDIPATIVDSIGRGTNSPFPGRSLTRFMRETPTAPVPTSASVAVLSELSSPNPGNPNQGRSPARRGPLISLADGNYVYIRNEGDGREQLFNEREDPRELHNRARGEAMLPILRRFRDQLAQLKSHLLTGTDLGSQPRLILNKRAQSVVADGVRPVGSMADHRQKGGAK